jgi:medium-chain acyl-[acyl-carrier-protein] hydrolase
VQENPFIQRLSPPAHAATRLICFPHAGSSAAAFRHWPPGLSPAVQVLGVQYPGRGSRLREAPIDRVPVAARAIADALSGLASLPTIFFGHSLGGAIAFEVVRCLAADGAAPPCHLFVSSRSAPHLATSRPRISHLPDAEFLREVGRLYAGVPPQLLDYPDVLALLAPALRADMAAIEQYEGTVADAVVCPITVFGGLEDTTTKREQLEAWRPLTLGVFRLRMFPGGHFYIETERRALLADMSTTLTTIAAGSMAAGAMAAGAMAEGVA